jgi:hypothetical protein
MQEPYMSQVECEFRGEQYVILVWAKSPSLRGPQDKIYREVAVSIQDAQKAKYRLQEKFSWCDVEIYHSPKRGVMHLTA